jgi:hypothetical protein
MDAMQIELSNFQPLAANEAIGQEVPDLGGAAQLSAPMIEESDQGLASLIRSVGLTSITDIDNLVSELQEARDYLQSEGESASEQRWPIMLPLPGPLRRR